MDCGPGGSPARKLIVTVLGVQLFRVSAAGVILLKDFCADEPGLGRGGAPLPAWGPVKRPSPPPHPPPTVGDHVNCACVPAIATRLAVHDAYPATRHAYAHTHEQPVRDATQAHCRVVWRHVVWRRARVWHTSIAPSATSSFMPDAIDSIYLMTRRGDHDVMTSCKGMMT